jgi:anti-sigma regulatory factor (Ser/Thr protein kinase)
VPTMSSGRVIRGRTFVSACGCDAAAAPPGSSGLSAETALLGTLTIPGQPEFARLARAFVARTLRGSFSRVDVAVLLTSELVGNSLQYSSSRRPGGVITITLIAVPDGIRAEVADSGGPTVPALCPPRAAEPAEPAILAGLSEGGRGLQLVDMLSARWSYCSERTRTITWFELAES